MQQQTEHRNYNACQLFTKWLLRLTKQTNGGCLIGLVRNVLFQFIYFCSYLNLIPSLRLCHVTYCKPLGGYPWLNFQLLSVTENWSYGLPRLQLQPRKTWATYCDTVMLHGTLMRRRQSMSMVRITYFQHMALKLYYSNLMLQPISTSNQSVMCRLTAAVTGIYSVKHFMHFVGSG